MNKITSFQKKRQKEQEIVEQMIGIYCRKKHGSKCLCEDCRQLLEYAAMRSRKCPFMEHKTFCSNCKVHCYKPDMREKIRGVMRFSGPRMLIYRPKMALWHIICTIREKKQNNREKS